MAKANNSIEILIKLLGEKDAAKKITGLGKLLRNEGQAIGNSFKKLRDITIGGLFKGIQHMGQTMVSAVMRTVAYGLINQFRNVGSAIGKSLKEAEGVSEIFGRTTAVLNQNNRAAGSAERTYNTLVSTLMGVGNSSHLTAKDLALVGYQLSLMGVRGKDFTTSLQLIDQMSEVTGQDAAELATGFVQLSNVFGVNSKDFKKLAESITVGMMNSNVKIGDFV